MDLVVVLATLITCLEIIWVKGQTEAKGGSPQVPCLFIFGDSLSDSGNNNNLMTAAKCNFAPYGIDFPDGPTGRFCNGRTAIDLIGDHLGLPAYIKAFPSVADADIEKGVNYASGSSGIKDETGFQVGQRVCMNQQLKNHQEIIGKIKAKLGAEQGQAQLSKCLYSVYVGSNDWMVNYYLRPSVVMSHLIPETYSNELIQGLTGQLDKLIGMGAKKVILFGMMPLGCLPILNKVGTCSPPVNLALKGYNEKLKGLVDKYNKQGLKFIYINSMDIFDANDLKTMVNAGLTNVNEPCCGMAPACVPLSAPCTDRDKRVYWDQAHPTEAANKIFAARAYKAQQPSDSYPMDISALAAAA